MPSIFPIVCTDFSPNVGVRLTSLQTKRIRLWQGGTNIKEFSQKFKKSMTVAVVTQQAYNTVHFSYRLQHIIIYRSFMFILLIIVSFKLVAFNYCSTTNIFTYLIHDLFQTFSTLKTSPGIYILYFSQTYKYMICRSAVSAEIYSNWLHLNKVCSHH